VGRMQNRWGPSRVGPFGLLQPLADGIKFPFERRPDAALRRETPLSSRRGLALIMALTSIAVVPIGIIHLFGITTPLQITGVMDVEHAGDSTSSSWHHLAGRLRNRPGRMVVQQQVFAAGLPARLGPDDQLRSLARPCRWSACCSCPAPSACAASWTQQGTFFGDSFRAGTSFTAARFSPFFIYMIAAFAETNRIPFDLAGSGNRTGRRLPHRVQRDEVRHVLHGRVRQHGHGGLHRHVMFLGGWSGPPLPARPYRRFCRSSGFRPRFSFSCSSTSGFAARCRASVMTS
jgi:hypothetical protein